MTGRISGILTFDGREYVVNTPPFQERTYKTLLLLHGGGGDGPGFRLQTSLGNTIGEDCILVFPTATLNEYDFTGWNSGGPFNPGADDVTYLTTLIDAMAETERVDMDDLWIVGHSNGAMMGYRLICEQPERWRGLYSIAGNLLVNNPDTFTGKLRETHGTDDNNVPINGGYGSESFFPVDYDSLYDVVPSFTNVQNPGIDNLNPLVGYGHSMASIRDGLVSQGTTLQLDIKNFIGA